MRAGAPHTPGKLGVIGAGSGAGGAELAPAEQIHCKREGHRDTGRDRRWNYHRSSGGENRDIGNTQEAFISRVMTFYHHLPMAGRRSHLMICPYTFKVQESLGI